MFRNIFRSPSTTTMLASAATAAFTGSAYASSSSINETTKCEEKPSNLPTFKGWRHRSDGTNQTSNSIATKSEAVGSCCLVVSGGVAYVLLCVLSCLTYLGSFVKDRRRAFEKPSSWLFLVGLA